MLKRHWQSYVQDYGSFEGDKLFEEFCMDVIFVAITKSNPTGHQIHLHYTRVQNHKGSTIHFYRREICKSTLFKGTWGHAQELHVSLHLCNFKGCSPRHRARPRWRNWHPWKIISGGGGGKNTFEITEFTVETPHEVRWLEWGTLWLYTKMACKEDSGSFWKCNCLSTSNFFTNLTFFFNTNNLYTHTKPSTTSGFLQQSSGRMRGHH